MNSSLDKQKEEEMFGSRRGCDIEILGILGIWGQQVLGWGVGDRVCVAEVVTRIQTAQAQLCGTASFWVIGSHDGEHEELY